MMRVAITRTLPNAEMTAERLRALGATPIIAPLLSTTVVEADLACAGAQALVFTSANGASHFAQSSARRDLKVFCVGSETARCARVSGFTDVRDADGDLAALAALLIASLDPKGGSVLHFAGDHVAGDLAGALRASGFTAERRTLYASVAASELPTELREPLDAILFHSARAAETFASLGAPHSAQLIAACLSPAVAKAASVAPWKQIIVAPRPREDALLTALLSPTGASA